MTLLSELKKRGDKKPLNTNLKSDIIDNKRDSDSFVPFDDEDDDPINSKYDPTQIVTLLKMSNMQGEPDDWLIEPLLYPGLHILAGDPKSGKSMLARLISLNIALGEDLFGIFKTKKAGVLYLHFEEGINSIRDHILTLAENRKLHSSVDPNLNFLHPPENFNSMEDMTDYIYDYVRGLYRIKLIIIDTIGSSISTYHSSGYSYNADTQITKELQSLALEMDVCILALHHNRKQESKNPIDLVLGTRGMIGPAESTWVLQRPFNSSKGQLHVVGRRIKGKTYEIKFDENILEWTYVGEKIDLGISPEREEIVNLLKTNPDKEMSTSEIAAVIGKKEANVSRLLHKLLSQELILKGSKYGLYLYNKDYGIEW